MIWKAIFSVLGLASFVWILNGYGFPRLAGDIATLGWWSVPLALSFVPVIFCYALAWLLVTPSLSGRHLPLLFRLSAVSVAWNNLSPFVKVLGEPIRVVMLERWMSRKDAARSMVLYNLVHTLGTLLAFFLGTLIILLFFPVPDSVRAGFLALLAVSLLLTAGLLLLPRSRRRSARKLGRGRLAIFSFWLRWAFSKIRIFYRLHPARFALSVTVEVAARFVEGLTFYIAFLALGQPVSALVCSLLDVGRALVDNVFFFVPYQVGSREGGILLLAEHALGVSPEASVSSAVLYRLVEIFWMGVGYLLWMAENRSRRLST